ncbi:hypothetical protein QUA82_21835 [Microcoleus sp. F8-D3]
MTSEFQRWYPPRDRWNRSKASKIENPQEREFISRKSIESIQNLKSRNRMTIGVWNTGLKLLFLRGVTFLPGVPRAIGTFRQVVASLILQVFTVAVEISAKF